MCEGGHLRQNWNVDTWAMSKSKHEYYLANGNFDYSNIANDDNAYLAVRSSGYAKFSDTMMPDGVLGVKRNEAGMITSVSASKETIAVVGILGVYDGDPQITLIDLDGVLKSDGVTTWYGETK